ncbi:hypothetical protein EDC56_1207 [Sinobacterium caligoides]|uniref:Nucleotidyltransferase n=1 Tax=Sinobacterium caligoides TaxID=933926 RepID=A0A3N2E0L0_9GAMM|nr:nucleotidyltransferase domain-containing protein [Sinobacterium caligoides]ROS05661.1 hypothetical protein EDC56_1207 [Sinobacterium caligoides]
MEANAFKSITTDIHSDIMARLIATEEEYNVRVLLAIESGSRAWGFASATSDYDVRFIYVHQRDWYLSVDAADKRDVIEYPIVDDIDINGWELRKALKLFNRSNPSFVEWINSPIVYRCEGGFADQARALLPKLYCVEKGIHHYRSMAKTNYRGYLQGDLVPYKKYLYVLRALLSVRWLERFATPAPIEFSTLLHRVVEDESLVGEINHLLARKRVAGERALSPTIKPINHFIETELLRLARYAGKYGRSNEHMDELNGLFRRTLAEGAEVL